MSVTLTPAEVDALRGLGQGQVVAAVERILTSRLQRLTDYDGKVPGWYVELSHDAERHFDALAASGVNR